MIYSQKTSINLVRLWERLDTRVSYGRNILVNFAVRILSIVTNSASCERAFSEFGIIHTKRRNRLSEEKVHKTTLVKMDLRRDQANAGLLQTRKRRHFSDFEAQSSEHASRSCSDVECSDSEGTSDATTAPSLTDLIRDIAADPDDPIVESGPGNSTAPVLVPLKDLFDYTFSMDIDYWTGGFRKLDEELARYDVPETSTPST